MRTYSIISLAYPDHYVRRRDHAGALTPIVSDLDRRDASFYPAHGLADNRLMSFRAILCGYLRHQDGAVTFQTRPGPAIATACPHRARTSEQQQFAGDATFILRPGLADVSWVSFESYSRPGQFLIHRAWKLWVEAAGDAGFDDDATFRLVPGLDPGEPRRSTPEEETCTSDW